MTIPKKMFLSNKALSDISSMLRCVLLSLYSSAKMRKCIFLYIFPNEMWQKNFNSNSFNCPRGPNGHWSFCLQQQCSDCTAKKEHFLRFEFPKRERECICSFKFSTLVFFSLPPPFLLPYLLPIISYPLGDPIRATDHRTNELCMGAGTDRVTVTN